MATTQEPTFLPSIQGDTMVAENAGEQAPSRTDAIGIEIPVVVHASKYSVGLDKALQPLHEKTHTAIVFPKGGVVRMSVNLSVGELVVLTNQQSGADVLCRVSSINAHPGSHNYVGLEFTQRAPDFWGQCFVTQSRARSEDPSLEPRQPIVATGPFVVAPVQRPVSRSAVKAEPLSPVSPASPPDLALSAIPVAAASVQPSGTNPIPLVAPPSSTNDLGSTVGLARSGELGQQPAANSPEVAQSTILRKGLWAIASIVVVVVLTVGGFLMGRHGQSTSPVAEVAVASPIARMQPSAVTQAAQQPIEPTAASAAAPALSATSLLQPAAQERAQEKSGNSSQQSLRRSVVGVRKLLGPLAKPAARTTSSEPPQVPQTPEYGFTANMLGVGSVAGNRADGPAPPTSAAGANSATHASRETQGPQLMSSPPPIYPAFARQMNIEGVVEMDALVDGTGKVEDVKVVSGPIALQQAAIEAVRASRYQPARLDGRPIAEHMKVNLDFHLNPPVAPAGPEVKAQPALAQSASVIVPIGSSSGSEAPKAISSPPPIYPPLARAQNIEGTVIMDILVDATGKVTQTKVISGPPQLQPAAVEAVQYWKYQPARNDGRPIAQHMQVSINFRIH